MRFVRLTLEMAALSILSAAAQGGDLVTPAPDEVLKAALVAQVRGDVEGMLAQYALDLYDPKAADVSRALFTMVATKMSVENFELTIRAVNICEGQQVALVRGTMSYTMLAPGYDAPTTEGVLAMLVMREQAWKLVSVNPDPLLDEELHAPSAVEGEGSGKVPG